jgi:hypothetical protein
MNGEGFAFACWLRKKIYLEGWCDNGFHGWHCDLCRMDWEDMKRSSQRT